MENNNIIYKNQLAIMIFIASITYKVVMLPQYMAGAAGNNAFISVAIMMIFEIIMYALVYYVITHVNLIEIKQFKWLLVPIFISIYLLTLLKFSVMFAETTAYTANTLFDEGKINYVILAFLPVLGYVVHKGGNNIARLSLILMWFIFGAMLFSVLFSRIKPDFTNILPIMPDGAGGMIKGIDKHYLWFGDYIPMLFFAVAKNKTGKLKNMLIPITLLVVFSIIVFFYTLVTAVYGNAMPIVSFVFDKIAVFNQVSELIGSTNFPTIISWILMSIVKLSLLLYVTTSILSYFIKKQGFSIIINIAIIIILTWFIMPTMEKAYAIATSGIRYAVAAIQYIIPIILCVFVKIKYPNKNDQVCKKQG